MDFIPVASSNIEAVAVEGDSLFVKFQNGGIYEYKGVPPQVFAQFMSAESKGSFLARQIRPFYSAAKVS